ncbi:hypothetical protein M9435_002964 [Picochlorum sp. BPE23]|nr:hypothetical protein M9435_002964 [Picochlorum sp. BPE23]
MSVPGETDELLFGSGECEFPELNSQDLEGLEEILMEKDTDGILKSIQGSQGAGLPKVLVQPSSNTPTEQTNQQRLQSLPIHDLTNIRSYGAGNTSEHLEAQQEQPHTCQKPGRVLKNKPKSGKWTFNYVRVLCRQVKDFKIAEEHILQGRYVTNVNWKTIAQRLNGECSTTFSPEQVKQKHKEVVGTVKALKDMSNLTGSQRWYDMPYKERRRCRPQIKLDLTRDEFDELNELIVQDKAVASIPKAPLTSFMTPSEKKSVTGDASERPSKENEGEENEVNSPPRAAEISGVSSGSYIVAKKTKRRRAMDSSTLVERNGAPLEDRSSLNDIVSEYRQQSSKVNDILEGQQQFFALMKNYMTEK